MQIPAGLIPKAGNSLKFLCALGDLCGKIEIRHKYLTSIMHNKLPSFCYI
jgi:hypothetical protein